MEQDTGVEPASSAWEADVLPMYEPCKWNYHTTLFRVDDGTAVPAAGRRAVVGTGIGTSTASLVFGAKHRLRRHRHKCRAGAFVYALSDPIAHVFLLSGHARLFVPKTQKERRFDGFMKPTNRRSKLCETFL